MNPEDKKKLQDAFNAAINASPYADEVVPGVTRKGKPFTRRDMVEMTLKSDKMYEHVDQQIASGKTTLDQYIQDFEALMKKSFYGPKR